MYKTSRNKADGTTLMINDCGHAISLNKLCEKPLQSATDMLKHMAAHNASRAFAPIAMEPEAGNHCQHLAPSIPAFTEQWLSQVLQSAN